MLAPLNLATLTALDVCAAWASPVDGKVLIVASGLQLGKLLLERFLFMPDIQCFLIQAGESNQSIVSEICSASGFSLIGVQPLDLNRDFMYSFLQNPNLRQLIMVQASWLGRKLLPEWNTQTGHNPLASSWVKHALQGDGFWSYRETGIGNLSSLLWGFLYGRLLALNRPDLADRCNARMRRHLFPATHRGPVYLSLTRFVRKSPGTVEAVNSAGRLQ